ncbi:biopolymer transporter ExbD [bacterium]|nr:biopolymer transporter ExbD [bacterium]
MMAEINITPMVDIVFILLIIFMVAAPMIEQGVDLDLPQTETVPIESPKDKFIVRVIEGRKGRKPVIFIGKIEVKIKKLEEKLKHNEKLQKTKELYLYAGKDLSYGFVVRVMAIIKKAGVSSINLVTEPIEER